MKRIVIWTLALVMGTLYAQAQGAGLSQGEAVKTPSYTPQTKRKTCSQCGITMGNVTYPWQHKSWCPHYREQGGGGSSHKSSGSSSTAYTAASAATSALGSLLSGMISSGSQSTSTPKPRKTAEEIKNTKIWDSKALQRFRADEKFWNVGDYAVVKGDKVKVGSYKRPAYGIKNTKTGNYVINPFNKKPKEGDKIIIRHDEKSDLFYDYILRLYEPPAGDPTGKPFIKCYALNQWAIYTKGGIPYADGGAWVSDRDSTWFQINDQDQVELLEEVKLIQHKYGSTGYHDKTSCYYIKRGGKVGIYVLAWFGDKYTYDSNGLATGVVSQDYRVDMIIPVKYDAINRKGSFYQAMKADGFDLYNGWDLKPANPGLKKYDELTKYDDKNIFGTNRLENLLNENKLEALLNGKYGVVDYEGRVIIPLIYGSHDELKETLRTYNSISYTDWYKQEAAKYIDKKGEYEKTDHFEARMKDAKLQEEYLREIMDDAPQRYLAEKTKGGVKLTIGKYDADNEAFPISIGVAPWNIFLLPVPIAEAEAFKASFDNIKEEAVKTAQLGIRYDAPSIETITFTTSDGKNYKYGE